MFSDFSVIIGLFKKTLFVLLASVLFGLFMPSNLFAVEPKPTCSRAELIGDNNSNTFDIKLNCSDINSFYDGETSLTQDIDLMNISLETGSGVLTPLRANIVNSQIQITFYSFDNYGFYDLSSRDLTIKPGVILNTIELNDQIFFSTINITDKAPPYSQNEDYDVNTISLSLTKQAGVLKNDIEEQSPNVKVVLVDGVSSGMLTLNEDGSFSFTSPQSPNWQNVTFKYKVIDGSDNVGNVAMVTLRNAPPQIKTEFYKVCDSCNKEIAKNGDIVKVSIESTKPVVLSDMYIAGQKILEYTTVDSLNNYFTYILGSNIDQDDVIVNDRINYSFNYTYAAIKTPYNKEDPIIIDNTPPVIILNDDEYIELYLDDIYEDPLATGSDKISDILTVYDLPVDVVGAVDTSKGGYYYLYYTSTDEAGNISATVQKTIYVIDEIAPKVTINKIDNFRRGDTVIISGSIDDPESKVSLNIEGVVFEVPISNIASGKWYMRFNTDDFKLGNHIVTVVAVDSFDNSSSDMTSFVVNEKPAVSVVSDIVLTPVVTRYEFDYDNVPVDLNQPNDPYVPTNDYQDVNIEIAKPINTVINWNLFGIDWYYWAIMISVLMLLLFWIFGK